MAMRPMGCETTCVAEMTHMSEMTQVTAHVSE
jgi:hypothetical protein